MTTKKMFTSFFALAILASFLSPLTASAEMLSRQLSVGARGTDVTSLQSFLATNSDIYPQGKVTGYFGFLTKAAVSNFQSANGLSSDGIAGRNTIPVINAQMVSGMNSNAIAPIISSAYATPSRNTATVSWNTQQSARGVVYYSTSPMTLSDNVNSVDIGGGAMVTSTTGYANSQSIMLSGLQANTTYYYLVYATSNAGVVSITWPTTFQTTN
jgi:peptidoglycan hydrolase-like protein with peptidoglycan-binding domain